MQGRRYGRWLSTRVYLRKAGFSSRLNSWHIRVGFLAIFSIKKANAAGGRLTHSWQYVSTGKFLVEQGLQHDGNVTITIL